MVRCIRTHGKMYLEAWYYVLRSMGLCIRCTVLCIRVLAVQKKCANKLDLATRPIKVVLTLCSPASFELIDHLFSFSPLRWIKK